MVRVGLLREEGHNQNKTQRYRCRDCHRTFTATRDTLIGRSKLPIGKWMLYVECFIDMLPLRESDAQPCPGTTLDWNGILPPYTDYWGIEAT